MADLDKPICIRRYEAAKRKKSLVDSLYQDCYQYAIPHRDVYFSAGQEGQDKSITLFDSTAVDSTARFMSRLQQAFTPSGYKWANFRAGTDIPKEEQHEVNLYLDIVRDLFFENLAITNFDSEISEVYLDLAVGTGAMLIQDYDDKPCTFTAVPGAQLTIGEGPDGTVTGVYWERSIRCDCLEHAYPGARMPDSISKYCRDNFDKDITVLEASFWDYSEKKYLYEVVLRDTRLAMDNNSKIFEASYEIWPWVVARWAKVAGETYGRGPLTNAIADIKTCNKVVEMILQNASLAVAGVYTAADDGVLNPNNVEISPGIVIPVGFNGGVNGRSLDVLPRSGDFDVGQLVLKDLRESIRRKLFDVTSPETVRSAEEIRLIQKNLSDDIGSSWGRIQHELISATIRRVAYIFGRKGIIPRMKIDGRQVQIQHVSPLAQLQNEEELRDFRGAIADLSLLHPQAGMVGFNIPEAMVYINQKHGLPARIYNTQDQIAKSMSDIASAAVATGADAGEVVQGS